MDSDLIEYLETSWLSRIASEILNNTEDDVCFLKSDGSCHQLKFSEGAQNWWSNCCDKGICPKACVDKSCLQIRSCNFQLDRSDINKFVENFIKANSALGEENIISNFYELLDVSKMTDLKTIKLMLTKF